MNKIFLSGYLTRDPDIKTSQSGKTYAIMGLAVNRRKKPNEEKAEADFFNLVAWDKTAGFCERFLQKGSRVMVEGNLRTNTYEKNGEKKYSVDIWVENIEFADSKSKSQDQPKKEQPSEISDEQIPFF